MDERLLFRTLQILVEWDQVYCPSAGFLGGGDGRRFVVGRLGVGQRMI